MMRSLKDEVQQLREKLALAVLAAIPQPPPSHTPPPEPIPPQPLFKDQHDQGTQTTPSEVDLGEKEVPFKICHGLSSQSFSHGLDSHERV
jgi:hypothetical protein